MSQDLYGRSFQAFHEDSSRRSAHATVPVVLRHVPARSVGDVGCGIGTWLVEFQAAGVSDYLGIDGPWVDRTQLLIDPARFIACDLTKPWPVDRRFDLATCLEVAEHLPESSAGQLVESLCRLAPVVLFSAAIPRQAGDGHINLQYPEYWRDRFKDHHYVVVDALRRILWEDNTICPWYRQNMMFYVDRDRLAQYPLLAAQFAQDGNVRPLAMIHPQYYEEQYIALMDKVQQSQRLAMRLLVRLRTWNLVVFPDWNQPAEVVRGQLSSLFQALLARRDRGAITLVVQLGGSDLAAAHRVVGSVVERYLRSGAGGEMPEVSAVGSSFGQDQWEVLVSCVQARIKLDHEDLAAIGLAGAEKLPLVFIADLSSGAPLGAAGPAGTNR